MGTSVQNNFIKEMIKENKLQNVGDVYSYLKDLFKDTIQEILEAELDASLGYPKNEKSIETDNERNGHLLGKACKMMILKHLHKSAVFVIFIIFELVIVLPFSSAVFAGRVPHLGSV